MTRPLNVIVMGSGVAGMAFALRLSDLMKGGEGTIRMLSKAPPEMSNSHAAQGGVAAVTDPAVAADAADAVAPPGQPGADDATALPPSAELPAVPVPAASFPAPFRDGVRPAC